MVAKRNKLRSHWCEKKPYFDSVITPPGLGKRNLLFKTPLPIRSDPDQTIGASLASVPSTFGLSLWPSFYGPLITFVPDETSVFPRPIAEEGRRSRCIQSAYSAAGKVKWNEIVERCTNKTAFQVQGQLNWELRCRATHRLVWLLLNKICNSHFELRLMKPLRKF